MATSIVETITPAKAKEYLDKSGGNRNISKPVVESYAASMRAGKWLLNGEAITFDIDGVLLNGHHRLHAVILAQVPIKTFVTRGVEHECFTTYDCGRHRTVGQLIGMQGIKNYNIVASAVSLASRLVNGYRVSEGSGAKDMRKSNSDMIDFFNHDRDFFVEIGQIVRSVTSNVRIIEGSIIGGSIYYLVRIGGYDLDYIINFFRQLCSLDSSENKSIDLFRKRLIQNSASSTSKMPRQLVFALLVKTWNAYVTNRTIKLLWWRSEDEEYPKFILNTIDK